VSFDIGGTFIKHGLLNKKGFILEKDKYPTNHVSKEKFINSLVGIINKYKEKYVIQAIGISIPGVVDSKTGQSILAGALYHLYDENIKELIEKKIDCPVYIENDANCALLAEKYRGNALGSSDIILLTIGTGIGGAIMVSNQLVDGHEFKSGEFGMMHVDISKNPNATLHDLASTSALIKSYKKNMSIPENQAVDGREIFEQMNKNSIVKSTVDMWLTYLSNGIFNMAVFTNPQKILIGGGISENPKLLPLIKEKLTENIHWKDFKTEIETCKFRNDAGLIGAFYNILLNNESLNI
jgi:beta-glucoside kinase